MIKTRFKKDLISIHKIGKQRFWIGVLAGLFSALSISLAFNHIREAFRYWTGVASDLLILEAKELSFFNNFFATLAALLGLSVAIGIWMGGNSHKRRKDRLYKQLSISNALLIFWVSLIMIARFGQILTIIFFGLRGYEDHLKLLYEFWLLLVLFPIAVFMQNWSSVRLVYRAGNWILLSFVFSAILAFILSKTTTVSQEAVNEEYFLRFEKAYSYVDEELDRAKELYGITYGSQTLGALKDWYSESAKAQINEIKSAFSKDRKVSLDTIILQKIIIHNCKTGGRNYDTWSSNKYWPYALPEDILKQIGLFDVGAHEVRELFQILREQIELFNALEADLVFSPDFAVATGRWGLRAGFKAGYRAPALFFTQLKVSRESLMNDDRYSELHKILPEIRQR